MKLNAGLVALTLAFGSSAMAADIFVRDARGTDLSNSQVSHITEQVKKAVSKSEENRLVSNERDAEFVLSPSVVQRGDQMVLRVEKEKRGDIVAMSEQNIDSSGVAVTDAYAVTEIALRDDSAGSTSGTTSSEKSVTASKKTVTKSSSSKGKAAAAAGTGAAAGATASGTTSSGSDEGILNREAGANELRAPSPRTTGIDRKGYFGLGIGSSFAQSLETDTPLFNVNFSYNRNMGRIFTLKGIVDANLSTGSEDARWLNFAIGGDFFPAQSLFNYGAPYLSVDAGYSFVRDADSNTENAPALGVGAGFKFQAMKLNWDLNIHYSYLTEEIEGENPSMIGARFAFNF
ncbi:MAG TPA: hypothetical protein VM432_08830 [Bdellovibrionales bacterium]|nr:hypothetical protein [Bdellovibrionales bacterium]